MQLNFNNNKNYSYNNQFSYISFKGYIRIHPAKMNSDQLKRTTAELDIFIKDNPKIKSKQDNNLIEIHFPRNLKDFAVDFASKLENLKLPFTLNHSEIRNKSYSSEICQNLSKKYHNLTENNERLIDYLYLKEKSAFKMRIITEKVSKNLEMSDSVLWDSINSLVEKGLIIREKFDNKTVFYKFSENFFHYAEIEQKTDRIQTNLTTLRIIDAYKNLKSQQLSEINEILSQKSNNRRKKLLVEKMDSGNDMMIGFNYEDIGYFENLFKYVTKISNACELTTSKDLKTGNRIVPNGIKVLFNNIPIQNIDKKSISANKIKELGLSLESQIVLDCLLNSQDKNINKITLRAMTGFSEKKLNSAKNELINNRLIPEINPQKHFKTYIYLPQTTIDLLTT